MEIDDPSSEYNAYCEGVLYGMEKGIELLIAADIYRNQYGFYVDENESICWVRQFRGELEAEGVGIKSLIDDAKGQRLGGGEEWKIKY